MKKAYVFLLVLFALMLSVAQADVTLPADTVVIEAEAFKNTAISGVLVIPEGVTTIGAEAFYRCDGITELVIPLSVTRIESKAFAGCSNLEGTLVITDTFVIADDAFEGCSDFTVKVLEPTPVEYFRYRIEDGAAVINGFDNSWGITDVVVPSVIEGYPVTRIENQAFYSCRSIIGITLLEGITSIGSSAFGYCYDLMSISLPDSLTSIDSSAFLYCTNLLSIRIPDSVKFIGNGAFQFCSNLIDVTLSKGLTSISGNAFNDCTSLTSITIPVGVTSIGATAFSNCASLTDVNLPSTLTNIADGAFQNCRSLVTISLPKSVKYLGDYAFNNCESLTDIALPSGLSSIGERAFSGCTSIGTIDLPDSVTSIGADAFNGCTALTEIDMPDGILNISDYMFVNCESLVSIDLPAKTMRIGEGTFSGCTSLQRVHIPVSVKYIGADNFTKCHSDIVICGAEGSYAETYAGNNNLPFMIVTATGEAFGVVSEDLLHPDPAPKSEASGHIERLIAFGKNAGIAGSALNTKINNMMNNRTTADVLAQVTIGQYDGFFGAINAGIESIILTLTDVADGIDSITEDFTARLFKETAMEIMGSNKLPDLNAASDSNLITMASDVTTVTIALDQLSFFGEINLNNYKDFFNEFAKSFGAIEIHVDGSISVIDQNAYDQLRNIFKMRTEGDINTVKKYMDTMLETWSDQGKCMWTDDGDLYFVKDPKTFDLCPEGKTYAAITKMRETAEKVQKGVERFGQIADVIGSIADAISIYGKITSEINELDVIRAGYTKNRQFLMAIAMYSTGKTKTAATELLVGLENDFDVKHYSGVMETLADFALEKSIDLLTESLDDVIAKAGGTSILGGILAGGKIAGMVPLVQDAKELIDCQHLIIGWYRGNSEIQSALKESMEASSPYTMYLVELYVRWQQKGLYIAQKYYSILKEHTFINNAEKVQGAEALLEYIENDELIEWRNIRVDLWSEFELQ